MRIKILMRFAKKLLPAILTIIAYAGGFVLFYRVSDWGQRNISEETLDTIVIAFLAICISLLASLVALWLMRRYEESRQEVERERQQSAAPEPPDSLPDWNFTIGGIVE